MIYVHTCPYQNHTVEITEFFSHTFLAKIRESNDFTNKVDDLTKYFFVEESKFFIFPQQQRRIYGNSIHSYAILAKLL